MRNLILLVFIAAISCTPKSENAISNMEKELVFKTKTMTNEVCVDDNCAKLSLSWPVASGPAAAEKMNAAIQDQVAMLVQTGEEIAPLDTLVETYFRSYKDFKADFPDSPGGWEIEAEGEVTYQSDNTLSIYFSQFNFMGGAHPNSSVSFLNFDPSTGEALSDDRVILDEPSLFQRVENKFREFHKVPEGTSIAEDGRFFLPEAGFFLANAKGFKEDKFWVIYMPYEIGPYAMGYTELEFSREELEGVVRW
jgi:hypothetical protein